MSTLCHEVSTLHALRIGLINIGRVFSRLARTHQGQSYPHTQFDYWTPYHAIQHMDHGPAFQALWRQLRGEVRALQNRGYYGDGTSHSADSLQVTHLASLQVIGLLGPD
jgi:hypothetical protein